MPIEFDAKITERDLYRFNLYHAYTGFQGIFAALIGLAVCAVAILTLGKVERVYSVLYLLFGVIFLVYVPVSLKLRAKRQMLLSPALRDTLHYRVDEAGIHVSLGEQGADLEWKMIYKIVSTKSSLLIYSSRVHAYIIPRTQLGDKYEAVRALAGRKLEAYRLRMKR